MPYTTTDTILSHPDKPLLTHLTETRDYASELAPNTTIPNSTIEYSAVAEDIALLHDIGKATQYFQRYLRDEPIAPNRPESNLSNHSILGAIIAGKLLSHKYTPTIGLAAFIAIKRHHGHLNKRHTTEYELFNTTDPSHTAKRTRILTQLNNLTHNEPFINAICSNIHHPITINTLIQDLQTHSYTTTLPTNPTPPPTLYEITFTLWSTLITADKLSAANMYTDYTSITNTTLSTTPLTKHITELQSDSQSQLNTLRETARQTAITWAQNVTLDTNTVYTLSLPTGFGKTFSALSAGLTLTNRTGGNLIYALPFTSIIDQVDEEIQDIFNVTPTDPEYTIHHYLAETRTTPETDTDPTDESSTDEYMLAKTWNSPLTLTTFVQLFESLTSPPNSRGLKIPSLKNSVIILDEPQALNYDWWHLIPKLTSYLQKTYNTTIISMTATQPTLFTSSPDTPNVQEILPNQHPYTTYLQTNPRVEYTLDPSVQNYLKHGATATPQSYDEHTNQLLSDTAQSIATICNTIDSAEHVTNTLITKLPTANIINKHILSHDTTAIHESIKPTQPNIIHLSTRITPHDRKKLLTAATYCTKHNIKLYVISTQLIEAGVDISFDSLYRDLCPLPSLVQAAGRCNRNNTLDTGTVTLTRLAHPDDNPNTDKTPDTPSAIIYNQSLPLLNATRSTLAQHASEYITEANCIHLVDKFYTHITQNVGKSTYTKYIQTYNTPELSKLSLINSPTQITLSITSQHTQDNLLPETPFDALSSGHKFAIISQLEEHSISIPLPSTEDAKLTLLANLGKQIKDQYYILRSNNTYDSITGFKMPTEQPNQFI